MEFRHQTDYRLHTEDVIRAFPAAATDTALTVDGNVLVVDGPEARAATVVSGTESLEPEEGRTLVGYPILFNEWTEIQSWDGPFLERIAPGAVDKTLAARGDKVQLMFNHGFDYMLEQTPIGRHMKFDPNERGVYNEAALVDRDVYPKIDLIAELIRMGAIYGQSFRFSVMAEEWVDEPDPSDYNTRGIPERTITEIRLYESGPVTYPAYEATSVSLRNGEPVAVRSDSEWKLWTSYENVPSIEEMVAPKRSHAAKLARIARSTAVQELDELLANAS